MQRTDDTRSTQDFAPGGSELDPIIFSVGALVIRPPPSEVNHSKLSVKESHMANAPSAGPFDLG